MTPYPYQLEGRDFLAATKGALLADEPGLGKTVQAILAAQLVMDPTDRALIICPASLRINWSREIAMWWPGMQSTIIQGRKRQQDALRYPFTIINYEVLTHQHELLRSVDWKVCVPDEAHRIKNIDAGCTREVVGGFGCSAIEAEYRWALTGTPVLNRPIELYPMLWWWKVPWLKDQHDYGITYCEGYFDGLDWNYRGASNLGDLSKKIKPYYLRREKKDVLKDLPDKVREVVVFQAVDAVRHERKELKEMGYSEQVLEVEGLSLKGFNLGQIARLRKATAMAGVAPFSRHIIDEMESSKKAIVFAYHDDVIHAYLDIFRKKYGQGAVDFVNGTVTGAKRQAVIDAFQHNPFPRILILQIEIAVGLTLTAANRGFFVEEAWEPGKNDQAEDRMHRIGQKDCVFVQHLVFEGSINAYMLKAQSRKRNVVDAIFAN